MLNSIQAAISKIDALIKHTNAYKSGILHGIKKKLENINSDQDLDSNKIDELSYLCHELLNDKLFTYKSVSLFGILSSHSEKFVHDLISLLNHLHLLALEKIERRNVSFNNYNNLLSARNYLAVFNTLCSLSNDKLLELPNSCRIAENWLIAQLEKRISTPDTRMLKRYRALLYPALEVNRSQRTYTIDKLIEIVSSAPDNQSASFTYAVDLNRNIVFSRGASTSFHYNLFQGADVYGAGEVYLRKIRGQIYLDVVNNRSGLYKPGTELLEPIVLYFNHFKISTAHTLIKDEAEELMDIYLRHRAYY